jgi:hypothetical protein
MLPSWSSDVTILKVHLNHGNPVAVGLIATASVLASWTVPNLFEVFANKTKKQFAQWFNL